MEKSKHRDAPRASWGKRIGIFIGVVVVVLVVGFFVVTSSGFIKAVVLPKAGAALNAKVTAQDVSLSPFSQLHLTGLRVETTGTEPLLTAQEVRVRYALMDIIKGNIKVDEVTLDTPIVQIIQQADGASNLDPILKGEKKSEPDKKKSGESTKLNVHNVSLKNGTVRQVQYLKGGGAKTTEIQGLNISLDQLGNGQSGKLTLQAGLNMEQRTGSTNDLLRGTISGGYDISLNKDLLPETLKGSTKLSVEKGQGAFADLAGFNGSLDADVTPKELRRIGFVFTKNGQRLGEIRASGPLDIEKKEGSIRIEILSLDKNVLALATAGRGMDFRQSQINSTNQITISQGATFFALSGNLAGGKISVTQAQMTTPEMNINLDYQATVNTSEKSAVLQKLNLDGQYSGKEFLRTELDRQMTLSWGETVKGYKDAALKVVLTNFNLADWRPVVGTNVTAGNVGANIALVAQQDGKILKTDLAATINGLAAAFGSNRVQNSDLSLEVAGTVEQLKIINLTRYAFSLAESQREVLQGNGAARYDLASKEAKAQLTARGELPRLMAFVPMTNIVAREGRVELSANVSEASGKRTAMGAMTLAGFTGTYVPYEFQKFQANLEYNVEMDSRKIDIHRVAATFSQEFNAGGSVDVKGRYDLEDKSGQFTFRAVDLNENAFRPVLAPSLGENKLVSISLNSSGEASLNPKGETAVKATAKLANWVVKDPAGKLPQTPLAADVNIDAGMKQTLVDLRDFGLKLSSTARAKNELKVHGKLDLGKTNPAPSTLAINAESLDLTPYYDLFAPTPTNAPTKKPASVAKAAPQSPPSTPPAEPGPMQLPFQKLTADLKIDHLYLRDIALSNWVGKITIQSNVVQVDPFKFDLNGAAMALNAKVDTGVAGYRYDVGLQSANAPLLPLLTAFGSDTNLNGGLIASAKITGAGITGPNIRKNLAGRADLDLTNMSYAIVGPRIQKILIPISLALRIPEITQTPINLISVHTEIGNGVVNLKQLAIQSEAFYAEGSGPIPLADILTNSPLNIPLEISLRRSLAEKARVVSADTPTNAKYAKLPHFATVKGTVGEPKSDISELVLAGILARGAAGFGVGGAEKALGMVGNLLTGERGATNAAGTNAPASTNQTTVGSVLKKFEGLLDARIAGTNNSSAKTNAAGTNASSSNPLDLLKVFQKKETKENK